MITVFPGIEAEASISVWVGLKSEPSLYYFLFQWKEKELEDPWHESIPKHGF